MVKYIMIFWILVIVAILGVVIIVGTIKISDKYNFDNGNKVTRFIEVNDYEIEWTAGIIAGISGVIAFIMLLYIIIVRISADGNIEKYKQTYKALTYKAQTEAIRDEFGIINKEYIDEIQRWNEDVASYKSNAQNFWIGIFYSHQVADELKIIDIGSIEMRKK